MKKLLLLTIILLVGCTSAPVKRNFPDVPSELMQVCPDLKEIEPTTKLSEVIKTVSENYMQYHECGIRMDVWIEWYKTQKTIFESVK
jgi:hypothetical protein